MGLGPVLALGLLLAMATSSASSITPARLRCEYQADPLGIDTPAPRLGWWLASDERGQRQSAYQVAVATSLHGLLAGRYDLWDSGKVGSDESAHVEYAGHALKSESRCYWRVRVWDGRDRPSAWSEPATWTMGMLRASDWHAQWIGANGDAGYAAVMLRHEFTVRRPVVLALASLCGLGYSELELNGAKVGDHVLDPGFTDYSRRALYASYDVTEQVRTGRNAVGILLGGGWYHLATPDLFGFERAPWTSPPKALFRLLLEFDDGTREVVASDGSWRWNTGPITFNCVRGGETVDARLHRPGWSLPGYRGRGWSPVAAVRAPKGRLVSQQHPPIRVTESISPVRLTQPKPGVFVFDLGRNIAGWARLQTRGPRGARIRLSFNEKLKPDGTVDMAHTASHTHGRFQTGEFVLAGRGLETYEPRFTYHGFRYVQVEGLREAPSLDMLTGRWVTTDPDPAGAFECSNPRVQLVDQLIRRSLLNNLHGIPTDCPQREKMGWMLDGCVDMPTAFYALDTSNFYAKWFHDMQDAQEPNGHTADIVPTPGWGKSRPDGSPGEMADPWWGGAIVMAPWKVYEQYGDVRILRDGYASMRRYVDYLTAHSAAGIVSWGLGDWLDETAGGGQRRVSVEHTSTAAFYECARIVSRAAALTGREAEAVRYRELAESIAHAFNARFLNADSGLYSPDSQTAQAVPLTLGLVPDAARDRALDRLVDSIQGPRRGHISAGILGPYYVFRALMEGGRNDLAWHMLTQEDAPGWLHMANQGATSLWEDWQGQFSQNHPTLGAVGFWLYEGLGGIRREPSAPGFKRILIQPAVVAGLDWVKCAYDSVNGRIECSWRRTGDVLTLEAAIPPNTTATIVLPTRDAGTVTESGRPATQARGVRPLGMRNGGAAFAVGSGRYRFRGALPAPPRG